MPESFIRGPVDSTGKMVRARERVVGANTVYEQYNIPVSDRVATFRGHAHTFRIIGIASATQHNLAYFRNATGSGLNVAVHSLHVDFDATAAAASIGFYRVWRVTASLPTGGTASTKYGYDSTQSSHANVGLFGAASADGTASAITWTLLTTTPFLSQAAQKYATYASYAPGDPVELTPSYQGPIILAPGEHLVLVLATIAATGSPITSHYVVGVDWEEFTTP